jgi:hypothetical protein
MRVFILGCGLYGCHAAMTLKSLNIDFVMADITNEFFEGSSSKNQNRLHLGFHYPRSFSTRNECKQGYLDFMERYSYVTEAIPNNIYLIDKTSMIDFDTYKNVYSYEDIPYTTISDASLVPFPFDSSKFQGMIKTNERYINHNKFKQFFKDRLEPHLLKNYDPLYLQITEHNIYYQGEQYDMLFDCTYFQAKVPYLISNLVDVEYELCISFLYQQNTPSPLFGFTVMDGGFFSIYPYDPEKNIYSLTDVRLTPVLKSKSYDVVRTYKDFLERSEESIKIMKEKFETNIKKYIPSFTTEFNYTSYYLSFKTKSTSTYTDDRSLIYYQSPKYPIHHFCGGKLTGIFSMENVIRNIFNSPSELCAPKTH